MISSVNVCSENLTADGQTVMENRYRYDAVDNILGITNAANPTSLTKLNRRSWEEGVRIRMSMTS